LETSHLPPLTQLEQQMLLAFRRSQDCLFIGVDHHGAQLTVAAALGRDLAERGLQGLATAAKAGLSWVPTSVFPQDGPGYLALLEHLQTSFPEVPRERYRFLSEPSYAKPCCYFLLSAGFGRHQVLWVDTRKVGRFRKAHGLGAGKSDVDDARAMLALLHHAASTPGAPVALFELPAVEPASEVLGDYAEDHARVGRQMVALQGKILQLVLLLFPELRRLWRRTLRLPKPGGGTYERPVLALFDTLTPLRVLEAFPGPRQVAEAGFDGVWAAVGGSGVRRETIRRLVELAGRSGGLDDGRLSERLALLIEEYRELEARQTRYKAAIAELLEADAVFASLTAIPCLGTQPLAALIGAIGEPKRFATADALKRYLNVAPVPLPQSGDIDKNGRPVQRFRLPANSYERVNGQRRLKYQVPGRKDARQALYMAFELIVKAQEQHPDDPFVRYYLALRETHAGEPRAFGRVRWKVAAKLVETIFYCLKYRRAYDPNRVAFNPQPHRDQPEIQSASQAPPCVA
jgi:hypothetical protein